MLHLLRIGLCPSDRAVVHLNNTPELVIVYYTCAKIGVVPVMALVPHRFAEIRYLAEVSGATAYFGPTRLRGFHYQELAREVRQAVPGLQHVLVAGAGADPDVLMLHDLLNDPIEEHMPANNRSQFRTRFTRVPKRPAGRWPGCCDR